MNNPVGIHKAKHEPGHEMPKKVDVRGVEQALPKQEMTTAKVTYEHTRYKRYPAPYSFSMIGGVYSEKNELRL